MRFQSFIQIIFIFSLIFFNTQSITPEFPASQWIIWNVGQGQWITHVKNNYCWHLDFGGEKNPIKEVTPLCRWRLNILSLSHADYDHFSFIKSIKRSFKQLCLWGPSWRTLPLKKVGVQSIPLCKVNPEVLSSFFNPPSNHSNSNKKITRSYLINGSGEAPRRSRQRLPPRKSQGERTDDGNEASTIYEIASSKNRNDNSQIVSIPEWLITGDAPQKTEKLWLKQIRTENLKYLIPQVTHLVLGHHGSKTSTSSELLKELSHLVQCIASARQKKYGHPHPDVRIRVRKFCSLILTEEWNHLHFLE